MKIFVISTLPNYTIEFINRMPLIKFTSLYETCIEINKKNAAKKGPLA